MSKIQHKVNIDCDALCQNDAVFNLLKSPGWIEFKQKLTIHTNWDFGVIVAYL